MTTRLRMFGADSTILPAYACSGQRVHERPAIGVKEGALVGFPSGPPSSNLRHEMTFTNGKGTPTVLAAEATDGTSRTELAFRESNGITVRLLWSRSTNLVTVAVADASNGEYFELVLDEHEQALDVFHHPYAHAAARGLDFHVPRPRAEVLLDAA